MKTGLTFLLIGISTLLAAQQAIIEPDNPSPRIGDQINLSILLSNTDSVVSSADNTEARVASGSLKLVQALYDTGAVKLGPFTFAISNRTYEAPMITLRVRPALPEGEVRGLWANIVSYQGYLFVIVEQRIPSSVKRDPGDPNTLVMSADEPEFAELNTERMQKFGLEFVSSSVNMDTQMIEGRGSTMVGVSYRLAAYKFRPLRAFPANVRIDKTFFSHFPKGVSFDAPDSK